MSEPLLTNSLLIAQQAAGAKPGQPVSQADKAAARQSAEEFEAVFLSQMLGHMFAGVETDGMFGGGEAEKVYRSLLVDEYGKAMSRSGGIGIADQVMAEILKVQEIQAQEPEQ
ncbi:MAG: rod-binding protein [Inquilinaceae bacterium]